MALQFGILTASDRSASGERKDETSPAIEDEIRSMQWDVIRVAVVPDDFHLIRETLLVWADRGDLDVIITTGGTGFSPRDVTPEATLAVIERLAPGMAEAMRNQSLQSTPHAMLSRGVAGLRGEVLIVNLPGSPKAALDNFRVIKPVLAHAIELMRNNPDSEKHHLVN
jgi:molybdopterin adenylyltransferase